MPLHLLGKKSWNVYNQDNIERVQRDEANAQAAEQDAERRRKDDDAEKRLKIMRGEPVDSEELELSARHESKRKRGSEDEFTELRRNEHAPKHARRTIDSRVESKGDLSDLSQTNVTQEPLDKISNMRFRDAAGRHAQQPWYSSTATNNPATDVGRDVWGNEDAGRQARDQKRLDANDPLLAMKRGVNQLKHGEKLRSEWRKEREKDLYEVEEPARRERHRRRRDDKHKRGRDEKRLWRSRHGHKPRDDARSFENNRV